MTDPNPFDAVRDRAKLYCTSEMGRQWVGCEHGRPDSNPRLCYDCFIEAIQIANMDGQVEERRNSHTISISFKP